MVLGFLFLVSCNPYQKKENRKQGKADAIGKQGFYCIGFHFVSPFKVVGLTPRFRFWVSNIQGKDGTNPSRVFPGLCESIVEPPPSSEMKRGCE